MKIAFGTVEDFCAELHRLAHTSPNRLWQNQVRFRIDTEPEQKEAISFKIALWLTALAQTDEGEYVLEYADFCGSDDQDEKHFDRPVDAGTKEAMRRIEQVAVVAKDCNLVMLPGKIEQF